MPWRGNKGAECSKLTRPRNPKMAGCFHMRSTQRISEGAHFRELTQSAGRQDTLKIPRSLWFLQGECAPGARRKEPHSGLDSPEELPGEGEGPPCPGSSLLPAVLTCKGSWQEGHRVFHLQVGFGHVEQQQGVDGRRKEQVSVFLWLPLCQVEGWQ